MTGVLRGASRESIGFIRMHWLGLVKVCAVPVLLMAIVTWLQIRGLGPVFQSTILQLQNPNSPLDPATASEISNSRFRDYGLELAALILFMWKYVRIIQYWKKGEGSVLSISSREILSTGFTMVYAVGMVLVTVVFGFVLALVIGLVVTVVQPVFGPNFAVALTQTLGVASVILLFVFVYRLLVGLPGIALGERPHFISDIWPLARGANWALPLRQLMGLIAGMIPILIVSTMFYGPISEEVRPYIEGQLRAPLPADLMDRIIQSFNSMQLVSTLLQLPIMWFGIVLTGIAHFRFRKKLSG